MNLGTYYRLLLASIPLNLQASLLKLQRQRNLFPDSRGSLVTSKYASWHPSAALKGWRRLSPTKGLLGTFPPVVPTLPFHLGSRNFLNLLFLTLPQTFTNIINVLCTGDRVKRGSFSSGTHSLMKVLSMWSTS